MNIEIIHSKCEVLSVGMRLREAREKLGLSQKSVAESLCLKVSIIRDIEEDKVPTNLASTFLRGYIYSYAKLVHIPETELSLIMKEYQSTIRLMKSSPIKGLFVEKRRKKHSNWLIIWLLLFVTIGLAGALWLTRQQHAYQGKEIIEEIDQSISKLENTNLFSRDESGISRIQNTLLSVRNKIEKGNIYSE